MIQYPTLYSRDSNQSVRFWYLEQDTEKYRSVSGVIGTTNPVVSNWQVADSKNVGKTNESSPEEQARKEILAKYIKKQSLGYFEDKNKIDDNILFEPMLAKKLEKKKIPVNKLNFIQPKLDGVRCVAVSNGLFSRQGKLFESVPHILKTLQPIFEQYPDLVLDGELYNHDLRDNFNQIISLVRKQKLTKYDLLESEKIIQYHIYDCYSNQGFESRFDFIKKIIEELNNSKILLVPTYKLNSIEAIDDWHAKFSEENFEGAMVRLGNIGYENKRSFQLMKVKDFIDTEYPIVRIEEGAGNRANMAGRIICRLDDGREFGAGIKGSHDYARTLLKENLSYQNGTATIRYFNLTPDGVPRFPVCVAVYHGARDI